MSTGGEMALSGLQWGWESTPGTLVAATRVDPILQGTMREQVERNFPQENRASFIANYRNFALKNYVEIMGVQVAPTYEAWAAWTRLFLSGHSLTGVTNLVTAKSYTDTPTIASDDLKTASFEVFDTTQNFAVPYVIGNKWEWGFVQGGPMTLNMDFLGQRAVPQAKTGALTIGAYEDIIGSTATVTIDTSTIGTTAVTNVLEAKGTLDNGWIQDNVLDGNLYPRNAHRSKARYMQLDLTLQFINMTEYTLFQNTGIGTPRKIRFNVNGTVIAGSTGSIPRNLVLDWYGVWETSELDSVNGMRVLKLSGQSQYDTTAGWDWRSFVNHLLSPLP